MVDIETFRKMALSFPEAIELPHFEKTSFRVNKKIFATLDIKNALACLMLTEQDQYVFSATDRAVIYPVPNKWGLKGATFVELKLVKKIILKNSMKLAYNKCVKKPVSKKLPSSNNSKK